MRRVPNPVAGETDVLLEGVRHCLRLSFGALAEIEGALERAPGETLAARIRRADAGDVAVMLAALLRGAGEVAAAARLRHDDVEPVQAAEAIARCFAAGQGEDA